METEQGAYSERDEVRVLLDERFGGPKIITVPLFIIIFMLAAVCGVIGYAAIALCRAVRWLASPAGIMTMIIIAGIIIGAIIALGIMNIYYESVYLLKN